MTLPPRLLQRLGELNFEGLLETPNTMTHLDYLGDLPEMLKQRLSCVSGDFFKDWEIVEYLAGEAERQIHNRHEISISLLDGLDLVEIAVQRSMVPSQKAEFAWRLYMRYFAVLVAIISSVVDRPPTEAIHGTLSYLLAKLKYEMDRRLPVIQKGGDHELTKILQPIKYLL